MNIIETINGKTLNGLITYKEDLEKSLEKTKKGWFSTGDHDDEFKKKNIESIAIDIAIFQKYGNQNIPDTNPNKPFYKQDREINEKIIKYETSHDDMINNYNPIIKFSKQRGGKHKSKRSNNKKTKKRRVNKNRKSYKKQ
jgi:hypothetical protein